MGYDRDKPGGKHSDQYAYDTAGHAYDDGLDQELREDVDATGSNSVKY